MTKTFCRLLAGMTTMLLAVLCLQVLGAGSASAVTCSNRRMSTGTVETCSGLRHETIAAKVYYGTNSWFKSSRPAIESRMDLNIKVADKVADGKCTWVRLKVTNVHWAHGNYHASSGWRVCGAGSSKVINVPVSGAWMTPGGLVEYQHCAWSGGVRTVCTTFFKRRLPR